MKINSDQKKWKTDRLEVWYIERTNPFDTINKRPHRERISNYFISLTDLEEWAKENNIRLSPFKDSPGLLRSNGGNIPKKTTLEIIVLQDE